MVTRSVDVDPSIITFVLKKLNIKDAKEVIEILNNQSGLLGVSGISSDMRELQSASANSNIRAKLAIDIFVNRIQKYIGSYIATMNGVGVIVFTAGIGENSPSIRWEIIGAISWFDIKLDSEKNDTRKKAIISSNESKITVLNVPTNEEVEIARDVERIANAEKEKPRRRKCKGK